MQQHSITQVQPLLYANIITTYRLMSTAKPDTPEHSDTDKTTLFTLSNAHPMRLRSNHTLETGSRVRSNPGGGSARSVNEITGV